MEAALVTFSCKNVPNVIHCHLGVRNVKHLIITGFDPFGGETVNPAWEAVKRLPDCIGSFRLTKLEIPTVFGCGAQAVLEAAKADRADVILCVGQAAGRDAVTPERIAVNIRDARISGTRDNAGFLAQGEAAAPEGPAAYFATVPVERMAQAIRDAGIRGAVSNTAGTFVCNDTLYLLLHRFHGTATQVGFIHVPCLPQQAKAGVPGMELEQIIRALEAAVGAIG